MDRLYIHHTHTVSTLLSERQEVSRCVDTDEQNDRFLARFPELVTTLLIDHTTHENIFWATEIYADRGTGYRYFDKITGDNADVILPRASKSREQQQQRSREMAEVFTPAWICNKQNNLIDNAWFGREGVFNIEVDCPDALQRWNVNTNPIEFPDGKNWRDYVNENRLEITCGEAPYIVSRHDAVTGEYIPLYRRIGMLDRKLRVVKENTSTAKEWLNGAQSAFKSIYGYEWQGDNLFLARKALLYTFLDYYRDKFNKEPQLKSAL